MRNVGGMRAEHWRRDVFLHLGFRAGRRTEATTLNMDGLRS